MHNPFQIRNGEGTVPQNQSTPFSLSWVKPAATGIVLAVSLGGCQIGILILALWEEAQKRIANQTMSKPSKARFKPLQ